MSKNNTVIPVVTFGGGSILVFLTVLGILSKNSSGSPADSALNTNTETTASGIVANSQTSTGAIKDGTYTSTVNFSVPHGAVDSITVKATIQNGVVSSITVSHYEGDRESAMYNAAFDSEYKSLVMGKKISSIALSQIGGASLTTNAFIKALYDINTQSTS